MGIVIGPVLRRADGYGFDIWNAGNGVTRGYPYRRIEDAHYARKAEIRHWRRVVPWPRSSARPSTSSSRNPPGTRCSPPPEPPAPLSDHY